MLAPDNDKKIFVSLNSVDMRKSINGLAVEVLESLDGNPQSGDLYIFRNRQSSLIKALYWDMDGFVLVYKRLEKHKFKFPKADSNKVITITTKQLRWLLSGFDFTRITADSKLNFDDYY